VTLLTELDAFYLDHRLCDELDAGVDGPVVWFDCECGARISRRDDAGALTSRLSGPTIRHGPPPLPAESRWSLRSPRRSVPRSTPMLAW
jgi:hypothetical protein